MAILPTVMQGSAICSALLESALTALLYRQVRRYSAETPKLAPPRERRSSDRTMTTRRPEIARPEHQNFNPYQ